MDRLFDSRGRHIANVVNDRLYAPTGQNIGRWLEEHQIFVDLSGGYMAELPVQGRLLRRSVSRYAGVNFGIGGTTSSIGNAGDPGNHGCVGVVGGFEDIPTPWI